MNSKSLKSSRRIVVLLSLIFSLQILLAGGTSTRSIGASNGDIGELPQVNVPNLSGRPFTPAIFWFGQVNPESNYADVRVYHYAEQLTIVINVIDRLVWYDQSPSSSDLTDWDAVSIYFDLDGNSSATPSTDAYLIQTQLYFQSVYRWDGSQWQPTALPISIESSWRGNGPNDAIDDKGWQITIAMPFTGLGLSGPPDPGSVWKFAISLHDRDDESGEAIPDQVWPAHLQSEQPTTWGILHFGVPAYQPPPTLIQGAVTIREGLEGAIVEDAHVGGHTICGENVDHWSEWGEVNYAGYEQINIQNQWDIADWPCFSKYYITFPLNSLPPEVEIVSATLTMTLFGNAGGGEWGEPPDSYIQVFTLEDAWDESALTWNNAPLAQENVAVTLVKPRDYDQPDTPYAWDVSRAAAAAYQAGSPLRLALYSADGERHTGKYFWSSDTGDWNAEARPTLKVYWGYECGSSGNHCELTFLPLSMKR